MKVLNVFFNIECKQHDTTLNKHKYINQDLAKPLSTLSCINNLLSSCNGLGNSKLRQVKNCRRALSGELNSWTNIRNYTRETSDIKIVVLSYKVGSAGARKLCVVS